MKNSILQIIFLVICCGVMPGGVAMQLTNHKNQVEKPVSSPTLSLTGEITSIQVTKGSNDVGINFKAKMTLRNSGSKPIVFLNKDFLFTGVELAQNPKDFEVRKLLNSSYAGMSCSQTGKEWINLRKKLDQPTPPAEETFLLMPNEEKVINAEPVGLGVLIDPRKGLSSKDKESASWEKVKNLPELWVKIVTEPYPSWGLEPDCYGKSFGEELQTRWKDVGLLWLDNIQSEPIELDLSSAAVKAAQK